MYNTATANQMKSKKEKVSYAILANKKPSLKLKVKNENPAKLNFSMNYWGQGTQKDDLSFFDLSMVLNY